MQVGEAYVHVKFSDQIGFDNLTRPLEDSVVGLARRIFVKDIEIEYVLEEGTLLERAKVIGKPLIVLIGLAAGYHELRESVIDMYNDAHQFGEVAIEQFHKITGTSPSDIISKRTVPTDVNRLHRIIQNTDVFQNLAQSNRQEFVNRINSDISGLRRSNPGDEGVQKVLDLLPGKKLPDLPRTVAEAVAMDERRRRFGEIARSSGITLGPQEVRERHPRRRYSRIISL